VPLRGFDQQIAGRIVDYMKYKGTHFLQGIPESIEKLQDQTLRVQWKDSNGKTEVTIVNTVLAATGRSPRTHVLDLEKANVQLNPLTQKIIVNQYEQSSTPNIYCVGDAADGRPELTPPAVQAGKLLGERLFGGRTKVCMLNFLFLMSQSYMMILTLFPFGYPVDELLIDPYHSVHSH
jgi:thioredoxin reductase (NADPH)